MNDPVASASPVPGDEVRRPRTATVAIWISAAAVLLGVLLVVPYMASPSRLFFMLLLVLVVAAGVAGIVLGVRTRRYASPGGGWALFCGLAALIVAGIMAVVFIVSMIAITSINSVELRGQGPTGMSATIRNDMEDTTVEWTSEGWAKFNTKGSWAELTLDAPEDADSQTVSCQIIWNDEVVVEEKSDSGSVTCRYDG